MNHNILNSTCKMIFAGFWGKCSRHFIIILLVLLSNNIQAQTSILKVSSGTSYVNRTNTYKNTSFYREIEISNVQQAGVNFTGFIKLSLVNHPTVLSVNLKINPAINSVPNTVQVVFPSGVHNDIFDPATGYNLQPNQEIILRVVNFRPATDLISITETVTVNECLTPYSNQNLSTFTASLVQTNSTTIPTASSFVNINGGSFSQQLVQGDAPEDQLIDLVGYGPDRGWQGEPLLNPEDFYCTGNNNYQHLGLTLKKSSLAKFQGATFWDFKLKFTNDGNTFTVDRNSILIKKYKENSDGTSTLIRTYIPGDQENFEDENLSAFPNAKTQRYQDPTSSSCVPGGKFRSLQYSLGDLHEDEYLRIEYDLYNCCGKSDVFNGLRQSDLILFYTYKDDCGNKIYRNENLIGPNTPYGTRGIYINADVSSAPAALFGPYATKPYPDLGNFIIDNPLDNNGLLYWGAYGGKGVIYNPFEAELVIRITAGADLRYTAHENSGSVTLAGSYPHSTNPGGFSYFSHIHFKDKNKNNVTWQPISKTGSTTSLGAKEIREFRFKLADLPEITPPITGQKIFDQFFIKMSEMQLVFTLEGTCSPLEDGNWSVDYLFNTDPTCSECLQPIASVGESVIVNCPGCKVPGAIARGRTERSFFGPFDFNNDGVPDPGETESSTHTLTEIKNLNGINTDPTDDIVTNIASAGDFVTISSEVSMTVPSDCNMLEHGSTRVSCRDNELRYKYVYLQVKVPVASSSPRKSFFDQNIANLNVSYKRQNAGSGVSIPASSIEYHYYDQQISEDIYYFKIEISDVPGFSSSDYFLSADKFSFSFESKVITNVSDRFLLEISYMGYFTQDEEVFNSSFINAHPNLFNRSYADCLTDEIRGMNPPACTTGTLQMICEFDQSFLILIPINTHFNNIWYTGFTDDKSCVKSVKGNSTGSYGGEHSNFGNPGGYNGINIYRNEFRSAPVIEYVDIAIPKGYFFREFVIHTTNNVTKKQHKLFLDHSSLSGTDQTLNMNTSSDRVLRLDLRGYQTLSTGLISVDQKIYYTDESSQPDAISIILLPDCQYLISNGISSTEMGNVNIGGNIVYTTIEVNNPYVGNLGKFNVGGSRPTYTPEFSSNPFTIEKIGAVGNNFALQKQKQFFNHFRLHTFTPSDPKDSYGGNVFMGVNPTELAKYFSSFRVYAGTTTPTGTPIIDWKADGSAGKTTGIFYNLPYSQLRYTDILVVGELNIAECSQLNKAIYDLIYGIHCNEADITLTNVLNNTSLCNRWSEHIELNLDEVDMLINLNANPGFPVLSNGRIKHEAVLTATRSEITDLQINLTNTPLSTFENVEVSIFKNTGSSSDVSLILTEGTHYTYTLSSSGKATIDIISFPANRFFESANSSRDYFNEVRVTFDVVNTNCQVESVLTQVEGIATPFYSTNCPIIRTKSQSADLNNSERPNVSLLQPDPACLGDERIIVLTGGNANYSYTWYRNGQILSNPDFANPDQSSIRVQITDVTNQTYQVNVVNGTCSFNSNIVTLQVKPSLNVSAGPDAEICYGSSVNLSASGATDYNWSPVTGLNNPGQSSVTANPLTTTLYTVTGSAAGYCSDTDEVLVTVRPPVSVGITSDRPTFLVANCNDQVILTATGGPFVTYQWSLNTGSGYQVIPGATNINHTATVAGDYIVTVTDAFGCSGAAYVKVADRITISGDNKVCEGEEPVLNVTISGVIGPYNVQTIFDKFIPGTPKKAEYYGILVFDVQNPTVKSCTLSTSNITVDVLPLPDPFTIHASGSTYICESLNQTVDLIATPSSTFPFGDPAWSYAWSTGVTNSLTLNNVSSSGSYSITVMDNNGCQTTSNAIIVVSPGVSISQVCRPDNSVILSANVNVSANQYIWRDASNNIIGNSQTVVVNANGVYSVEIPGLSCPVSNSTQVCIQPMDGNNLVLNGSFEEGLRNCPLPYGIITDQTCQTGNVPSSQWPGSTIITRIVNDLNNNLWISNGGFQKSGSTERNFLLVDGKISPAAVKIWSQENVAVDACGTYKFRALIDNIIRNEREVPTVWLTVNGSRITSKTKYPSNQPDWIELSGDWYSNGTTSVNLAIYMEKGGWVGRDIGVDEIEFYKKGCISTSSRGIDILANVGVNKFTCSGTPIQIGANIPDPSYTYLWTAPGGYSSNLPNPIVSPTSTTVYTLSVTDGAGNIYSDNVTVYITPTSFSINAGNDVTICSGGSVQLQASGSVNYNWSPSIGLSSTVIPDPIASPATTITYTVSATDPISGCLVSDQIIVSVNAPTLQVSQNKTICANQSTTLTASGANSYLWSTGAITPGITVAPVSTTSYTVTGTDANNCVNTLSVLVTVNPLPVVNAGNDVSICRGSAIMLNPSVSGGTAPYSYQWTPALGLTNTNIANPLARPSVNRTYQLTVTDQKLCQSSDQILVAVLRELNLTRTTNCTNGAVTFTANIGAVPAGLVSFQWQRRSSNGFSFYSNIIGATGQSFTANTAGFYRVIVTTSSGCSLTSQSERVIFISPMIVSIGTTSLNLCSGNSTTLSANVAFGQGPYTYQWSTGATSQQITVSPNVTTTYTLIVRDVNGCSRTATQTITVNPTPVANAGADVTLCRAIPVLLGQPAIPGNNYVWRIVPGNIVVATTAQITDNGNNTVTYRLTVTRNGCSASDEVTVTRVNGNATIVGPPRVCRNQVYTYSLENVSPNAATVWNVTNATIISQNSSSVTFRVINSNILNNVRITATYTNCQNQRRFVSEMVQVRNICIGNFREGYEESKPVFSVTLYPNPTLSEANLIVESQSDEVSVTIYDLSGKVVEEHSNASTAEPIVIGKNLRSGSYIVKVSDGENVEFIQFLKTE